MTQDTLSIYETPVSFSLGLWVWVDFVCLFFPSHLQADLEICKLCSRCNLFSPVIVDVRSDVSECFAFLIVDGSFGQEEFEDKRN